MNYDVPNDAFLPAILIFALAAAMFAVMAERTRFFPRAVQWLRKDPVVRTALVALLLAIGPITARTKNGQMSLPRPPLLLQVEEPAPEPSLDLVSVRTNGVAFVVASSNAVEMTAWRRMGGTEMGSWIEAEEPFFMLGTNPVHRAYACASGSVSFESMRRPPVGSALPDLWMPPSEGGAQSALSESPPSSRGVARSAGGCLCPLRAPLGFVPEARWLLVFGPDAPGSRFWHDVLPGGGMVLTWENALVDRLPSRRVSLQVELRPSGDCAFRYDFPDELDPPPTNFVMGAQMGTNGVNALFFGPLPEGAPGGAFPQSGPLVEGAPGGAGWGCLSAIVRNVEGEPVTNGVSVADLLCTNGILRTPASFELRWRNTTGLAPEADTDDDGLTDWDEIFLHGTEPMMADTDLDGVPDGSEVASGLHPLVRDSDGDGLVDGSDPDPASPTPLDDLDGDTLPDAYETHWFGGTNVVDVVDERDDTGFTLTTKLLGGVNPTNAPAEPFVASTNALVSWRLLDGYAADWPAVATNLVWERTFSIHRTSAWQQFFVSSSPTNAAAWCLDGMVLEWETDGGSSGTVSTSPCGDSFRIPLPADDLATTLTLRLRATEANGGRSLTDVTDSTDSPRMPLRDLRAGNTFASLRVSTPLHLIAYAPELAITGGLEVVGQSGATFHVFTNGVHSQVGLSIDHSLRPCRAAPVAAEFDLGDFAMSNEIGPSGGPLTIDRPGIYTISSPFLPISLSSPSPAGLRNRSPAGDDLPMIVVLDPSAEWQCHGHGCGYDGLGYDWGTDTYGEESAYPLDSSCLRKMWYRDWSGGWITDNCELQVRSGLPGGDYGPVSCAADGSSAFVLVEGVTVWTGSAPHSYGGGECPVDEGLSDECGCDSGCENGNCDSLEGASLGSLRFRIPLGAPVRGQVAGFAWLASDGPLAVTRSAFRLLPHPSATVSDTTASGVRHIVCNNARGRDLAIEDIAGGVRVTIRETASQALEHTWEIVNENGDPARIRLRKISRLNNVMSDETFAYTNGYWTRIDNISGAATRLETYGDWSEYGATYDYRTTTDAQGRVLADVAVTRSRIGSCDNAVLRETYRSEATGRDHAWTAADYWDDPGHSARHGRPRLVWGNARSWVYTDFDDDGREILRVEQRGNADVPWSLSRMDAGGLAAIAPHLSDAFVTVRDYTPLPGDSCHPDDADRPRIETKYVVQNGVATVVGRTWTRHTRLVRDGYDAVKSETWRAASPNAAFGDVANAYSYTISYTDTGDGTPLLLRGALAESLDEDGILTVNAYSLSGGVLSCASRRYCVEQSFPTYETTERDAAHGTLLRRTTRLADGDAIIADEQSLYDEKNRLRSTTYLDGTSITNAYSCCRLLWTQDREGRTVLRSAQTGTDHLYHAMEDVWLADVSTNGAFRVTQHYFDALGRETNTVVCIGTEPGAAVSQSHNSIIPQFHISTVYPYGGDDCVVRTDERGAVTRTLRNLVSGAVETVESVRTNGVEVLRTTTRSFLGGGTTVRREWTRGGESSVSSVPSVSGSGAAVSHAEFAENAEFTSYLPDGRRVETSVTTSSDYGVVTNSVSTYDLLGRLVSVSRPGANVSVLTTSYVYDGATSRVLSSTETAGDIVRTTAYLYNDCSEQIGTETFGVTNRTDVAYETDTSNIVWRVETASVIGPHTNSLSSVRTRLTGLSDACRRHTVSVWGGAETLSPSVTTETVASFDPVTAIETETTTSSATATVVRQSAHGVALSTETSNTTIANAYDAFGRVSSTTRTIGESDPAPHQFFDYAPCGDLLATHTYTNDTDYVTESYISDALGRRVAMTDALCNVVYRSYDPQGNVTAEGGATYPVRQTYDTAGRRTSLSTTRDNGATWDTTTWTYDSATGLCLAKTYADGSTVTYTYTPDGLPLRTTHASGAWVEIVYDETRREVARHYSDETLDCVLERDAFGALSAASNTVAMVAILRDSSGMATNETHTIGGDARTVVRAYDARGRLSCLEWFGNGDAASRRIDYGYDSEGRIATATNGLFSVAYDYHAGGYEQAYTLALPSGATLVRRLVRNAHGTHPIETVQNFFVTASGATNALPSFAYALDGLMRPVWRNSDEFSYDVRSQLAAATLRTAETNVFSYIYDTIGNRTTSSRTGVSVSYLANSLNQYVAVGEDAPSYDLNGNLLTNGVWSYAWDAANRLAAAYSNDVCVVSNAYDALSRRVLKVTPGETRTFLYDGWNVVREEVRDNATGAVTETRDYYWGRDLSGSLQGAGGVGGLLAYTRNDALCIPVYDHIGNVVAVVDGTGATVTAYEYDPFGNIIAQSGAEADDVPFRFSTKYFDSETGLYYYGYRFYEPQLGRWINRDLIGDDACRNLYSISDNHPCLSFDLLGLVDLNPANPFDQFFQSFLKNCLGECLIDNYYLLIASIVSQTKGDPWFESFLRLYFSGDGTEPMVLSASQVAAINTNPKLFSVRSEEVATPDRTIPEKTSRWVFGVKTVGPGNSTLGQFNVHYRGKVCSGRFVGEYRIVDRFDFDWKPWISGGRTIVGELQVRAFTLTANGMPFDVTSEWIPFAEQLSP